MEREKEIARLVSVLRKTGRMAAQAAGSGTDEETASEHGIRRFNKVLERLAELDPEVLTVFEPLADDDSLAIVSMACGELAAYYRDEASPFSSFADTPFDKEAFKDFWRRSARDLEEIGDFIRDSLSSFSKEDDEEKSGSRSGSENGSPE